MDLATLLQEQTVILLDGGMGTQLAQRGCSMGGQNCLTNPAAVLDVHACYVQSGAQILITNTLTMNRIFIETHHLGVDVREVNLAGARLAKQAAGAGRCVVGDLSSTGKLLEPFGDLVEAHAFEAFREQAALLAEGGVDGFIVETMTDLKETLCAVRACKSAAALPVIASLAFTTAKRGGRTMMGNSVKDCAQALQEAGADVVGANCGDLDPLQMAEIVAFFREATALPIAAQPNAGKPKLVADETIFDMTPADFAAGAAQCVAAGARLVGGCCGTSPEHIRAVAELLEK